MKCTWEFTPRSGHMAGTEICTLTGRACIIDDAKARPTCTRAAMIRAWQQKHYPDEPHKAREEAARQASLPF